MEQVIDSTIERVTTLLYVAGRSLGKPISGAPRVGLFFITPWAAWGEAPGVSGFECNGNPETNEARVRELFRETLFPKPAPLKEA